MDRSRAEASSWQVAWGTSLLKGETLWRLAHGPSSQVTSWQTYDVNGYTFYTKAHDQKSVSQNNGVHIENVDVFG